MTENMYTFITFMFLPHIFSIIVSYDLVSRVLDAMLLYWTTVFLVSFSLSFSRNLDQYNTVIIIVYR